MLGVDEGIDVGVMLGESVGVRLGDRLEMRKRDLCWVFLAESLIIVNYQN
jgi:hypothetical protein